MKALVIFDSNFGNTKIIAETISRGLGKDAKVLSVSDFNKNELEGIDLLVVGSPIIGWKPSEKMEKFLAGLSSDQLKGLKAATFDTRIKLFISGDASKKIAKELKRAGAEIVVKPQAFLVKRTKGPLFNGEIEKATEWATSIKTLFKD